MKEDIVERIERYFKITSLYCSDCGSFGCIRDKDGNVVERMEDYGIYTKEDFDNEVGKENMWLRQNKRNVLAVLHELEDEWPASCKALRTILDLSGRLN